MIANTHTHAYVQKCRCRRTIHPCIHTDSCLLVEQGGFRQNVDFVTGAFHINEEEQRNGCEAKDNQPDHGEHVRQDYKLDKRNS